MAIVIYSRVEKFLNAISTGNSENLPVPQSRIEIFLKAIIDGDLTDLPIPQSRTEEYLNHVARNGSSGNDGDFIFHNVLIQDQIVNILNEVNIVEDKVIVEVVDAT